MLPHSLKRPVTIPDLDSSTLPAFPGLQLPRTTEIKAEVAQLPLACWPRIRERLRRTGTPELRFVS